MKRYLPLIMILISVILIQVNSCTVQKEISAISPELQQSEMTGRMIYLDKYNIY